MRLITTLIIFFFLYGNCFGEVITFLWGVKKSEHFAIYFQEAPLEYVDEVINRAEHYYQDITEELGFTRFNEFWTWNKGAKIYLFNNKEEYQKMANQPDWSAAGTDIYKREIYSYVNMENFFDTVLPHELGHIIFREFVGYKRKLPLWLDEGIASFLEKKHRQERLMVAKMLIKKAAFMTVSDLGKMKRGRILMPDIFYAESASIIEFLLKVYGKDEFVEFCRKLRNLRDNQNWETILQEVYKFNNVSELNKAWMNFLISLSFVN